MRTTFLMMTAFFVLSLFACGQKDDKVPANVKTAFTKKFPNAEKVKWGMENAKEWEAEFKMNGKEYSANYAIDGKWLETEYEIAESEIPAAVIKTLSTQYPGYKLLESEISESADAKVYEFEIKTGTSKMEVSIKPDGTLIKNEAKEKGKDNED